MSRENVELIRSVHPPSGTDLTRLFAADTQRPPGLGELASLLTDDFEVVGGDQFGDLGLSSDGRASKASSRCGESG